MPDQQNNTSSRSAPDGTFLLQKLRQGDALSMQEQVRLVLRLSLPAMLAQVSSIIMQYIDASMVGRLGSAHSASIGLVSSSTWLFGGVCTCIVTGYTVQVAQQIGANQLRTARNLLKQAFAVSLAFCALLVLCGACISDSLPRLLGGAPEIRRDASLYFLVYVLSLPFVQLNTLAGGMLQASGSMKVPSVLHMLMCALDMLFNLLLIFPSGTVPVLPGAGLGVVGAALGTALAQAVIALLMLFFLFVRSPMLHLRREERFTFSHGQMIRAFQIALPVGFEHLVTSGAMVVTTHIVSPLGTLAIAANSFAVTAEGLCYMPGYGIGAAANTLIGQSVGAQRRELAGRLAFISTGLGMLIMSLTGALMYAFAPQMMGILSPDKEIIAMGTAVLRIEALAEPMFAASIVASGALRGAGDTLIPSCLNFFSMWAVRLPLSAFLAPRMGLSGVWLAMCIELCVRGALFLVRLARRRWLHRTFLP